MKEKQLVAAREYRINSGITVFLDCSIDFRTCYHESSLFQSRWIIANSPPFPSPPSLPLSLFFHLLGEVSLREFQRANKTSNTSRKISITIMSAAAGKSRSRVCLARLLAVGHDGILIAIVASVDSSSSRCPTIHPLRRRPLPYSATYLPIRTNRFSFTKIATSGGARASPARSSN